MSASAGSRPKRRAAPPKLAATAAQRYADTMEPLDLGAALAVWRDTRHPDLAALLRSRSVGTEPASWRDVALGDPSPEGTARLAFAFDRDLVERRVSDAPTVEAAIAALHADLFRRVAVLQERCPDPRVADAALRVLSAGLLRPHRWGDAGAPLVYRPVVELLVAAGDPSLADAVETLGRKPLAPRRSVREALAQLLPAAAERLRAIPVRPLPPPWDTQVKPPPRPPSTRGAAELWADLVSDPANDEILAVLGDAWIEAGDPRGSIVALERQHGSEKQIRALYRAHRDLWLGTDLHAVFAEAHPHRGVLVKSTLHPAGRAAEATWHAALHDERLATLRVLRTGGNVTLYRNFATSPLTRALEEADASDPTTLAQLAERRPPSLQVLTGLTGVPSLASLLASAPGLARVHTLGFTTLVDPFRLADDLQRAALDARIRALDLGRALDPVLTRFSALLARLPSLQRVAGEVGSVWVTLERRDDEWRAEVELSGNRGGTSALLRVLRAQALRQVPIPPEVVQVRLRDGNNLEVRAALTAALHRLL